MSDTIYRAMGQEQCKLDAAFWHNLDGVCLPGPYYHIKMPAPLTDWRAFGEILEWAESRELLADCLQHILEHDYGLLGGPDFRTAVLAALESAIGGEQ